MRLRLLMSAMTRRIPGCARLLARLRPLVVGLASYTPEGVHLLREVTTARYCYSVWLRHLVMAARSALDTHPKSVAELGPGESLGVGLAALISGCDEYFAFDVVRHSGAERNEELFDELLALFRGKAPIPGREEFPEVKPHLETYEFPSHILGEARLTQALDSARLQKIRLAIRSPGDASPIQYRVPWSGVDVLDPESVDMIFSQAVLEHIDRLREAYMAMYQWLRPEGYVSHQVDFRSHGTASEWNGHWRYSDATWRVIRGRRPYLLNREPHSAHLALLREQGFEVVCDQTVKTGSRYAVSDLARRFRSMSADDLVTSGAFIQATKKPKGPM